RCSRKRRPYPAALLGADAFIVLDEAHLVPPFEAMVRAATEDEPHKLHENCRSVVPLSRVMSLSATGRVTTNTLGLSDADRAHEIVRRRLDANKHIHIAESIGDDALADTLASKAWEVTGSGQHASRVIVFVDSRKTAEKVRDAI